MTKQPRVLCSCCQKWLSPSQERRHRRALVTPRANLATAAAFRRASLAGLHANTLTTRQRIVDLQPHPVCDRLTASDVSIPVGEPGQRESALEDVQMDTEGVEDDEGIFVLEALTETLRSSRMGYDESSDESSEEDSVEGAGYSSQEDEDDESLPGLSAWDELGNSFAQELSDVGRTCSLRNIPAPDAVCFS